jgi:hypothetical protein
MSSVTKFVKTLPVALRQRSLHRVDWRGEKIESLLAPLVQADQKSDEI